MNAGKGFFSRNRRTGFDHLGWVLQLSDLTPQNNSLEELIEPLLSADIDNCITLCYTCHKKVHQKDGCRLGQLRMEEC